MKNVLMLTGEAVPFIKTGGLADVAGSLPQALDPRYFDCRVMLPLYACIDEKWKKQMKEVTRFRLWYLGREHEVGVFSAEYGGVLYYFLNDSMYFDTSVPYVGGRDDIERFCFFDKAVPEALKAVGFRPDVIHCNDWQTGLVPVYLREWYHGEDFFRDTRTVFSIHNLKFQGVWDTGTVRYLSELPEELFTFDKLEAYGGGNMLKGGIVYSDAVTTVSPTYCEEIKTPEYGEGLDGLLRWRQTALRGILNGLDYDLYNPATDPVLEKRYDISDFRRKKMYNKKKFLSELGLASEEKTFLIGMVTRLTDQKGFDLVGSCMDELMSDGRIQVVILGTGEKRYEEMLAWFEGKYAGRFKGLACYSDETAHKIYGACDAYMMPSLFEPCGLSQLIALRYGTVPVVRETGGLKDTVEAYNRYAHTGTGFSFAGNSAGELLEVLRYAASVYFDCRREWNKIVERGMAADFSWRTSALKYQELYDWLTAGCGGSRTK